MLAVVNNGDKHVMMPVLCECSFDVLENSNMVVKPLPAMFSFKCFLLCSTIETSEAGSLSESGFTEPSDRTGSKEKYPKLSQNLPTFDPKTKGKDNPLIFSERLRFAFSGMSYPENVWHYALISQIKDPLAQHWAMQNLDHPEWPWDRFIATFHDHFGSRNLQNVLHTEFYHFSFKAGDLKIFLLFSGKPFLKNLSQDLFLLTSPTLTSLADAISIALEHESALKA
ncbi:hypothetical protein QOT17_003161 [Balamuthia mandrillaris]